MDYRRRWWILLVTVGFITIPLYIVGYRFVSHADDDHEIASSLAYTDYANLSYLPPTLRALLPRLQRLDCAQVVNRSSPYVQDALREGRLTLGADPSTELELSIQCDAVRNRWHFPEKAASQSEARFPLAFARTVYKDYLLVEQMLAVEYSPQNLYCYALDAKATPLFKRRIHSLASCFHNVIIAPNEFDVKSNGKNVSRSHLDCMQELFRYDGNHTWKYVFLLQNQDIPLRINAEKVEILRIYNGTNEVGTKRITWRSIREDLNWTLDSLNLYKNGSHPWPKGEKLHHTKSLNLVALSREAVFFMLDQLNLDPFIDRLEQSNYGMDEVFVSSLNSNLPDFPGGYTWKCMEQNKCSQEQVNRYVIWDEYWNTWPDRCQSGYFRHGICVMGLEDLHHLHSLRLFIYANKMLPEFDYGAIHCWLQMLATAQRLLEYDQSDQLELESGQRRTRLNLNFFANLPHVRYNRLRAAGRLHSFRCC